MFLPQVFYTMESGIATAVGNGLPATVLKHTMLLIAVATGCFSFSVIAPTAQAAPGG